MHARQSNSKRLSPSYQNEDIKAVDLLKPLYALKRAIPGPPRREWSGAGVLRTPRPGGAPSPEMAVRANWALSHILTPTRPANAPTGRLNGSPPPVVGRPGWVYQG